MRIRCAQYDFYLIFFFLHKRNYSLSVWASSFYNVVLRQFLESIFILFFSIFSHLFLCSLSQLNPSHNQFSNLLKSKLSESNEWRRNFTTKEINKKKKPDWRMNEKELFRILHMSIIITYIVVYICVASFRNMLFCSISTHNEISGKRREYIKKKNEFDVVRRRKMKLIKIKI